MPLKLGELLVASHLLTPEQVEQALAAQRLYGGRFGTNLVELKFISDDELARFLAKQFKMPAAEARDFEGIPPAVIAAIDANTAEKHQVVPLRLDKRLIVALSDPSDIGFLDPLTFETGKSISVVIAPEIWIIAALERYYGVSRPVRFVSVQDEELSFHAQIAHDIAPPLEPEYKKESETPKNILSFAGMTRGITEAADKEGVFSLLLDFVGTFYPRSAVVVARQGTIGGWLLRGFPVRESEFVSLLIPTDEPMVIKGVIENHEIFSGRLPTDTRDNVVAETLGIAPDRTVDIFPIVFRNRGIAALLALREGLWTEADQAAMHTVALACTKAGLGLEMIALQREILQIPSRTGG